LNPSKETWKTTRG
jgi:hypothetical protein